MPKLFKSVSGQKGLSPDERFKLQYSKEPGTGCWVWLGYKNGRAKRGVISVNGKQVYAHRWAYQRFVGPIPDGKLVCHTCDNPSCVNPKHLFIGTQNDNMKDMKAKGRANKPRGESNGRAKLTEEQVLYIRKVYKFRHPEFGQKALARKFSVVNHTIAAIIHFHKWTHISPRKSGGG